MAMTVESMRKHISECYDSWRWRDKVSKMPDNQVMAIYFSMKEKGKLKKDKKPRYRQMTIFDYI